MAEEIDNDAMMLIDQMSAPQEHAIAEAASEQAQSETGGETDAAGEAFNPSIHSTGSDGKGIRTAKGLWRRRRGAGGTTGGGSRRSVVGGTAKIEQPTISAADQAARAAGVAAAATVFVLAQGLGGPEWKPVQDASAGVDEPTMLGGAFGDYFVAKGISDFPPGVALTIALIAYAAPRMTQPITQSKMQRVKSWAVNKWVNWRMRRGTRTNPRHDGERENNPS